MYIDNSIINKINYLKKLNKTEYDRILNKIKKEIDFYVKYKIKKIMLDIFAIIYNNNNKITFKKDSVLFNLNKCSYKTIIDLCEYLKISFF